MFAGSHDHPRRSRLAGALLLSLFAGAAVPSRAELPPPHEAVTARAGASHGADDSAQCSAALTAAPDSPLVPVSAIRVAAPALPALRTATSLPILVLPQDAGAQPGTRTAAGVSPVASRAAASWNSRARAASHAHTTHAQALLDLRCNRPATYGNPPPAPGS